MGSPTRDIYIYMYTHPVMENQHVKKKENEMQTAVITYGLPNHPPRLIGDWSISG